MYLDRLLLWNSLTSLVLLPATFCSFSCCKDKNLCLVPSFFVFVCKHLFVFFQTWRQKHWRRNGGDSPNVGTLPPNCRWTLPCSWLWCSSPECWTSETWVYDASSWLRPHWNMKLSPKTPQILTGLPFFSRSLQRNYAKNVDFVFMCWCLSLFLFFLSLYAI